MWELVARAVDNGSQVRLAERQKKGLKSLLNVTQNIALFTALVAEDGQVFFAIGRMFLRHGRSCPLVPS